MSVGHRHKRIALAARALVLSVGYGLWSGAAVAAPPSSFLRELAPGVYVHAGQYADLDSPARGDSANLGVVIGRRCVGVVDSGGALATGRALKAAIAALTPLPVCYVINTHVHFDHVLGNAAFVGPATEFVGHADLAAAIAANIEYFAERFATELGSPGQGAAVIAPTVLVKDSATLDLGGRHLHITAVATAHSTTDITVLDDASDILFTGDLLFRERLPVLDGSLTGWLTWLHAAMAKHYAQVVPGHGPPDAAWPAGAEPELRYFQALLTATRGAIAQGMMLEDAVQSVAAAERARWLLSERAHPLNVSRAFRELEWE